MIMKQTHVLEKSTSGWGERKRRKGVEIKILV